MHFELRVAWYGYRPVGDHEKPTFFKSNFNFKGSKTHYVDAEVYQFLYQSLSRTLCVPGLNVKLNLNSFVVPCSKKYGQVIQF